MAVQVYVPLCASASSDGKIIESSLIMTLSDFQMQPLFTNQNTPPEETSHPMGEHF